MAIWKVSYVVTGSDHPGGILNLDAAPKMGDQLEIGDFKFKILEIFELMAPKRDFHYLHITCRLIEESE